MDIEDESVRKSNALLKMHNEDLSTASIDELIERIEVLKDEIKRVETTITAKKASHDAAESIFKT